MINGWQSLALFRKRLLSDSLHCSEYTFCSYFRIIPGSNQRRCSVKKGVLKNFLVLQQNTCVEACNFIKKETLTQMFSSELCESFRNTSFTEHLRETASVCYDFTYGALTTLSLLPTLALHLKCKGVFSFNNSTFINK